MTGRIDIAGAGAFGTALAVALDLAGREVRLWARSGAAEIAARREAPRLPGVRLTDRIGVTGNLADLDADIRLIAVPTQQLEDFLVRSQSARVLVSCAKGIHQATGLGPASLIAARVPGAVAAQMTGPAFATDLAAGLPTAMTLACASGDAADLQAALSTPTLRLYRTDDIIGAELGGALKNVMAIAAGAVMGAGLGVSARAGLIARGFAEMRRVALNRGAREETLAGLSGLGDLLLTCTSENSRNYRFGVALARGDSWPPDVTVEGRATAEWLAAQPELDTPIADVVAALATGGMDMARAIDTLMNRPLKAE